MIAIIIMERLMIVNIITNNTNDIINNNIGIKKQYLFLEIVFMIKAIMMEIILSIIKTIMISIHVKGKLLGDYKVQTNLAPLLFTDGRVCTKSVVL